MKKHLFLFLILIPNIFFSQNVEIIESSDNVIIKPLNQLNSNYRETNISITPNGKYMYFMSDRGGQDWSIISATFRGKQRYDGDIWCSENKNGIWQKPKCLSQKINTYSGEDEPNISPDGQKVYFQSWRNGYYNNGGPYYVSTLYGKRWGTPQGLGGGINKFFVNEMNKYFQYGTDGMSVSPDEKTFIVACGKDYDGNLDLYISQKINGQWSYLRKMPVSTFYDERSVFIAADGKTIYFASSGYGGKGGLDIFKATLDEYGNCHNITNIGPPFNTYKDDYGFIVNANGKDAYFVRDGDIYYAQLPDQSPVAPQPAVVICGKITDCNNKPKEVYLKLLNDDNEQVEDSKSSFNGEFLFSIPEKPGQYRVYTQDDVLLHSFEVKKQNTYQEIKFNLSDCRKKILTKKAVKKHTEKIANEK